jgi:hypothetical protein
MAINLLDHFGQRIATELRGNELDNAKAVVGVLAGIGDASGMLEGIRLTDAFVYRRVLDGVYERDTDPIECFIPLGAVVLIRYATAAERESVDDAFAERNDANAKRHAEEAAEYAGTGATDDEYDFAGRPIPRSAEPPF